jgi:hypothetical protein
MYDIHYRTKDTLYVTPHSQSFVRSSFNQKILEFKLL